MFEEMRKAGSSIPDKVEYLQANGWQSYKHHDNWVKVVWSEQEKNDALFDLNEAFDECAREQLAVKDAVDVLRKALKEDKGLYLTYQANIAMAFQDEFWRKRETHAEDFTKWLFTEGGVHQVSNNASHEFLRLLIS